MVKPVDAFDESHQKNRSLQFLIWSESKQKKLKTL